MSASPPTDKSPHARGAHAADDAPPFEYGGAHTAAAGVVQGGLAALLEAAHEGVLVLSCDGRCAYANPAAVDLLGLPADQMLGVHAAQFFVADEREQMRAAVGVAAGGGAVCRASMLARGDGGRREVTCTLSLLELEGEDVVVLLMRDVTEEQRLARKTAALARVARSIAYAGSLSATLDGVAQSVTRASWMVACAVILIEKDPLRIRVAGKYHLSDRYAASVESLWRAGVPMPSVEAFEQRQVVVFRDARRQLLEDPRCAPLHEHVRHVQWDTMVAVPLIVRGKAVGSLTSYYPATPAPDDDEIAFLRTAADLAAVAVENARLINEAQVKAALEERQRLARELHDSVSQALYGIVLGASTARSLLDTEPQKAAEPLDYALSLAEAGMVEMRALIFELRPESLATEGLVAALEKQAASLRARYGLDVRAELPAEPEAPLEVKEALYRIAQEALHNVVKHAQAHTVTLRLTREGDDLALEVADDGQGFDAGREFPGHIGQHSMRERAAQVGGGVELTSAPGQGTRVTARVPITERPIQA